jgi:hypothetical protein
MTVWSDRLAAHYGLRLPLDLVAWIDLGIWEQPGGAEFNEPQPPDHLIEPNGAIWGGFMLPDTLPVIGNAYGDWLCLRVAADGGIREVVYWCHGGGDWIPYGRTLAEALLYDAASRVLFARKPEFTDPEPPPEDVFRWAAWAATQLPAPQRARMLPFWKAKSTSAAKVLDMFADAGIAAEAVRRDRALAALGSRFRRESNPRVASQLGVAWEPDFMAWQFDAALIPQAACAKLESHFGEPFATLTAQNWDAAEREVLAISRPDLGWAHEIAGWAAERRGDTVAALQRYAACLHAPVFSDQAVSFRTQWFPPKYGKFAAFRLHQLQAQWTSHIANDPYLALFAAAEHDAPRTAIRDYWLSLADAAEREGNAEGCYQYLYHAGWDMGLPALDEYGPLLERMAAVAEGMGSSALAKLARAHLRSLL